MCAVALKLRYFSFPLTLHCAIFLDTDYWIGTDQHDIVGHIDEMMVEKFQQGNLQTRLYRRTKHSTSAC